MKRFYFAIVVCVSCLMAAGADTPVAAPRLGYLYDSTSHGLRAVEGIAGAALLGPVLDPGIEISLAAISPDQRYALAITAEDHKARILALGTDLVTSHGMEGAEWPVDRIALSPTGAAAVLYDASGGMLRIVTGLPYTPGIAREISYSGLERMAISDDGRLVVAASVDPRQPIVLFDQSAGSREIPVSGPISAMVFRPNSHDLLLAAGGLTLVRDADIDARYQSFSERSGSPLAVAFSRQGRRFFAAYSDGTIWSHDLASGESSSVVCACVPTILQSTDGDSVFLLNEPINGPLFLLDGGNNRIVFVAKGDL